MPSWEPVSEEQIQQRRIVEVNSETVTHTSATDIPGHWYGEGEGWDVDLFKKNLNIKFHLNKPYDAAFSVVGVDASIANAFRRIMLADIPTLAIEDVFIFDNTSIIQDEVLAHRLGLIPLTAGPGGLQWLRWYRKPPPKDDYAAQAVYDPDDYEESATVASDFNTIVLSLDVECRWATQSEDGRDGKKLAREGCTDPAQKYVNSSVYAHQLLFHPQGMQVETFAGSAGVKPTNPNILIAKLRPGQRIHLRCHCIKGTGADHAKFSPVCTASYRLLPHINITSPIIGTDAKKFARCFPKGVIELVNDAETNQQKAVVKDPMKDTVSREVLRHDEFKGKVKLGRIRDHFIFSVESTGQIESDELFLDAVRTLKVKVEKFKRHLSEVEEGH